MKIISVCGLLIFILSFSALAKDLQPVELRITDSYLELHTGPGSEYRIEHILLTGEKILLKKQHADWFYFSQNEKVYGWAQLKQLLDNRVDSVDMTFDEFLINYEGELEFDLVFKTGVMDGDFILGFELGHQLDEDVRMALSIRQVPGKISKSMFTTIDLEYFFNKLWGIRPYIALGYGELTNTPSEQVIGGQKVSSAVSKLGLGLYFAESKRIKFSAGLSVYSPDNAAFSKELHELSIGLKYDF